MIWLLLLWVYFGHVVATHIKQNYYKMLLSNIPYTYTIGTKDFLQFYFMCQLTWPIVLWRL